MHVGAALSGMAVAAINLSDQPATVRKPNRHRSANRATAWHIQLLSIVTDSGWSNRLLIALVLERQSQAQAEECARLWTFIEIKE